MTVALGPSDVSAATTRREFLALLGASGLLAACQAPESPTPAAPATRRYAGGYGAAEVPLQPTRVTAMYATDSDIALVLGLPLVGAYGSSATAFPPYQAARMTGVQPLVTFPEPNYEAIAGLRPDLILHGSGTYSPEQRDPLTAIAPVLAFPEPIMEAARWRDQLREAATVLERPQPAEAFISAYDERAAALRERVQARWGGATIAYVGPLDPGVFYIAQKNMQTNYTLNDDLGMPHAAVVPASVAERRTDISYEEMGLLADVDVILLRINPREGSTEPNQEQTAQITGTPLWSTLPAVRAGAAFPIDGDLFYASPLTAEANLDWAERTLLR